MVDRVTLAWIWAGRFKTIRAVCSIGDADCWRGISQRRSVKQSDVQNSRRGTPNGADALELELDVYGNSRRIACGEVRNYGDEAILVADAGTR